ncbi:cinnamoyl-CoA reductase 1-like protein [Tanacetum coccineum]
MAVNFPLSCSLSIPLTIRAPCMNDSCGLTLVNVALVYKDVISAFGRDLSFLSLLRRNLVFDFVITFDGPVLPPPTEMKDEGFALCEWRRYRTIFWHFDHIGMKQLNKTNLQDRVKVESDDGDEDGTSILEAKTSSNFNAITTQGSTDPGRILAELIDHALKGTLKVLGSCSKASTVKRVVVTSSVAAVAYNGRPRILEVVEDETWFFDQDICSENMQDSRGVRKFSAECTNDTVVKDVLSYPRGLSVTKLEMPMRTKTSQGLFPL